MDSKLPTIALAVALVGAVGFAAFHKETAAPSSSVAAGSMGRPQSLEAPEGQGDEQVPPNHPGAGGQTARPLAEDEQELPPNHPPIGAAAGALQQPAGGAPAAGEASPGLTWKVPAAWPSAPNPSSMRLATYKIPHVAADKDDAELSISRAGGDVESNIERWAGQFTGGATPVRREKTVHGLKIAIVETSGTYGGGMGPAAGSHDGWALLGAIVVGPGQPYFFKMTGPLATVHGARAGFESLLDSVATASP